MAEHCGQLLLGDGVVAGEVVEVEDELGLFGHRAAAADGDADEEFFKVNLARALPVEDGEEALWRVRQNCGAAAVNCRPGRHAQPQAHLPSCQGAGRILEMCPCPPSCRGSARTDPGDGRVQGGPGRAPAGRWRRPYLKCLLQDPELAGVDWCAGEAVVRGGSLPQRQRRHPGRVRPHVQRCVHCLNSASLARLVTVPIAGGRRGCVPRASPSAARLGPPRATSRAPRTEMSARPRAAAAERTLTRACPGVRELKIRTLTFADPLGRLERQVRGCGAPAQLRYPNQRHARRRCGLEERSWQALLGKPEPSQVFEVCPPPRPRHEALSRRRRGPGHGHGWIHSAGRSASAPPLTCGAASAQQT